VNDNTTILTIGDRSDWDSYVKSHRERNFFKKEGFHYATAQYSHFLNGRVPRIKTDRIIIFFFFPFRYWNRFIEHKKYKGVYGNKGFYRKFLHFWDKVERHLKRKLPGKEILYINNPKLSATYRDKVHVINQLAKVNVSQPRLHKKLGIRELLSKLESGHRFFLKMRYGSMGKGITFMSQANWQTNFIFENNKILSKKSDKGWKFSNVTGNRHFLKQLLKKDIIIQEGIDPLVVNGYIVDLRIYTFLGEVICIYPRRNTPDKVTTNISQGGKGDPKLLKYIPQYLIKRAMKEAVKVSKALNVNLAGIDIIPDRNFKEVYVIDANVFSGFPKRRLFNLARHMASELGRRNKKGKLSFQ